MLGAMANDPTQEPPILYDVAAGVATITLNRPERKNSLSDELVGSLSRMLDRAIADDDVRVVVLTNTGNTFCAGADLKSDTPGLGDADAAAKAEAEAAPQARRTFVEGAREPFQHPFEDAVVVAAAGVAGDARGKRGGGRVVRVPVPDRRHDDRAAAGEDVAGIGAPLGRLAHVAEVRLAARRQPVPEALGVAALAGAREPDGVEPDRPGALADPCGEVGAQPMKRTA